jgi:AraC-like DNA-binding protein
MSVPLIPRRIMLPPPGRPHWLPKNSAAAELLYLSWGTRWMGNAPIPLAMHDEWCYALILAGTPVLKLQHTKHLTKPGDVFIFHPDCAYGWQDTPKHASRFVTWHWRNPPTHSQLTPDAGGFWHIHMAGRDLRQLVLIHQHCQRDVGLVGEIQLLSLRHARLELDIALAKARQLQEPANRQVQVDMALRFLRHNLAIKQPVKTLCEHLKIAPAMLRELFLHYCGHGPQAVLLDMRMNYARERLTGQTVSVKEVAYELGYRHANDLSRAYKKQFGVAPRMVRQDPAA